MNKRISLKQLAQHVGLTEGTVSRALNGYADISPKTRAKVQQAADALGYKPNLTARRLATGQAEAVAYVMPATQSTIAAPFVAQLLQGLSDALSKRGWDLLVVHTPEGEAEAETIRKLVSSGKVSGIVLSRPGRVDERIDYLKQSKFPFVVHGRAQDDSGYAWYDIDAAAAYQDAVDHLHALGHRRIGFIGGPSYFNFVHQRLHSYRNALAANDLPYDGALVAMAELSDDGGRRAAVDLLSQENAPSALLAVTDIQAIGALAAIRNNGMTPGQDVSVIGYDGLWLSQHTDPPLTTLAQPQAHSGRILGETLLSIIDGATPDDFQILRRAELVRRKSTGPYRGLTHLSQINLRETLS